MLTNNEKLIKRIYDLEDALSDVLEWAEMVAGSTDFNESDTLQEALNVLNDGETTC